MIEKLVSNKADGRDMISTSVLKISDKFICKPLKLIKSSHVWFKKFFHLNGK